MHDDVCLVGLGRHARGQSAAGRIIDDQRDDVGTLLVAQLAHLGEDAVAVDHAVEMVEMLAVRFVVVDQLVVHEAKIDVAEPAVGEGLVGLLD